MTAFILITILFLCCFSLLEYAAQAFHLTPEITRKIAHIIGGAGAAVLPYFLGWNAIMLLALLFITLMIFSRAKKLFNSIHDVKRHTYGEILLPLGALVASLPRDRQAYFLGLIILAFADTAAYFIGTKFGRHTFRKYPKTFEGSMAFCMVSLVICCLTLRGSPEKVVAESLAISLGGTTAEFISEWGWDNVTIPLVAVILVAIV